ncbi:MAG: hypothetical protein IT355_15765 [Gemmatimonadaceae bacterium]|nr:hypothetical protein [Gemmatimonadaceae bacterium]
MSGVDPTAHLLGQPDGIEHAMRDFLAAPPGVVQHAAGEAAAIDVVASILAAQHRRSGSAVRDAAACDILRQAITRTQLVRRPSRQGTFSRYQWLWYLRRAPNTAFVGGVASTLPYARAVTEALAVATTPPAVLHRVAGPEGHFPLTRDALDAVAWLIGYSRVVVQLHSTYRRCAKGSTLILDAERLRAGQNLDSCDDATRQAVRTYDLRLDHHGPETVFAADVVAFGARGFGVPDGDLLGFAHTDTMQCSQVLPGPRGPWVCRYLPQRLTTTALEALLDDARLRAPGLWKVDAVDPIAMLALGAVVTRGATENLVTVMAAGYALIHVDVLREEWAAPYATEIAALRHRFPAWADLFESDLLAFLRRCMASPARIWPLGGIPLAFQATPDHIGIDLAAATRQFLSTVRFPAKEGDVPNARSHTLETQVQARIDASAWRPPPALRALRGRKLKLGGRVIGEIDALGVRDGIALLVSCKSIAYTDAHERGDYGSVTSATKKILTAQSESEALLGQLRATPAGGNYDFSGVSALHGVVVTPHVFYVPSPHVDAMTLPGLRAYATVAELQQWLDRRAMEAP